jgi:hypothetical protein
MIDAVSRITADQVDHANESGRVKRFVPAVKTA